MQIYMLQSLDVDTGLYLLSNSFSSDDDDDDFDMMMFKFLKEYSNVFIDRTVCRILMFNGKEYVREILCGNYI